MTRYHEEAPPPYEAVPSDLSNHSASTRNGSLSSDVLAATVADLSLTQKNRIRTTSSDRLRKPVAIPATSPQIGSPFTRAYPPTLETFGVSKEVFVDFLDDLNRVAVKSPPLQVLKQAGLVVSFVPVHTAQIVGSAVNAAASVGTIAVSKGRTELALRKANRRIFMPCGLKCEVAKLSALAKIAGIPVLNDEGKIEKNLALLEPIDNLEEYEDVSSHQRRLDALSPYIARLDVSDIPEINMSGNPLSKWSTRTSEKQREKAENKMLEFRHKAHDKAIKRHRKLERREEKLDRKLEKLVDDPDKSEKKLRKLEKKNEKFDAKYDEKAEKIERKRQKKDKEEKGMRKILWLIIRDLDAPSGVQDGEENPCVPREGESDAESVESSGSGTDGYELESSEKVTEKYELES